MDVRWMLMQGLMELLKTKSISNISVQSILEKARVSRYSFYKYYRDKYDLALQLFLQQIDSKRNNFEKCNREEMIDIASRFYSNMIRERKLIERVYNDPYLEEEIRRYSQELHEQYWKAIHGNEALTDEVRLMISFFVLGGCNAQKIWIQKGLDISADRFACLIVDWVLSGSKGLTGMEGRVE